MKIKLLFGFFVFMVTSFVYSAEFFVSDASAETCIGLPKDDFWEEEFQLMQNKRKAADKMREVFLAQVAKRKRSSAILSASKRKEFTESELPQASPVIDTEMSKLDDFSLKFQNQLVERDVYMRSVWGLDMKERLLDDDLFYRLELLYPKLLLTRSLNNVFKILRSKRNEYIDDALRNKYRSHIKMCDHDTEVVFNFLYTQDSSSDFKSYWQESEENSEQPVLLVRHCIYFFKIIPSLLTRKETVEKIFNEIVLPAFHRKIDHAIDVHNTWLDRRKKLVISST